VFDYGDNVATVWRGEGCGHWIRSVTHLVPAVPAAKPIRNMARSATAEAETARASFATFYSRS